MPRIAVILPGIQRGSWRALRSTRALALIALLLCLTVLLVAKPSLAQGQTSVVASESGFTIEAIRSESPRETLETFQRLTVQLEDKLLEYIAAPSLAGQAEIVLLSDQFISLLDLSSVSSAARRETGVRTYGILIDIFGRIGLPDPAMVPDLEAVEAAEISLYRIPRTPLRLVRMTDGERQGEFLFSGSTVQIAPRFLGTIHDLPLTTRLDTDSVTLFGKQLTGPLIPSAVVRAMPLSMRQLWLDTPIWKVVLVGICVIVLIALIGVFARILRKMRPKDRAAALLFRMLVPIVVIVAAMQGIPFLSSQINPSGRFATGLATGQTVAAYLAFAWFVWLAVRLTVEWIIRSPRIADESFDAGILRLGSIVVGIIAVSIVLVFGGQEIGLPVMSIVAGLGIGGLAVALAVRPTLENLIGGVILYVDRPVSVGDFCSFGTQMGTVQEIGIRSTKLRAVDRTIISVPNAQLADMQIVNWAECDEMLVRTTIGLRHETSPDQLRYLLAEIRRMLHAHPRVNADTVRVRFAGIGTCDLQVDLRFYVMTRDWNDFFAIREDIYFRILEIVESSGTGFAYPSQTVYLGRDGGLDETKGTAAEEVVARWRQSGQLPFPRLTPEEIESLKGTLDYPAKGSPDVGSDATAEMALANAEPLSARDMSEASKEGKHDDVRQRRNAGKKA